MLSKSDIFNLKFVRTVEERKLWDRIGQEMMTDEEDVPTEKFTVKFKSPHWRSKQLTSFSKNWIKDARKVHIMVA